MSPRKYRGKRVDNGKWVYGWYIQQKLGGTCYRHFIFTNYDAGNFKDGFIEVIPETVGQSTGLKDKKGVEIYEGDIDKSGGVVIWNQDDASFYMDHPSEMHPLLDTEKWFEVVGNRHQNPELQEAAK